jgi:hypothetical protein
MAALLERCPSGGTLDRPGTPDASEDRRTTSDGRCAMDLLQAISTDGAILLFSAAGLVATTVAILADTKTQKADLARDPVRVD